MTSTCSHIETSQLVNLVEESGPIDADSTLHLAECETCQQRLQEYQKIAATIATLGEQYQRSPNALQNALREVHATEHKNAPLADAPAKGFRWAIATTLVAAAALLLFLKVGTNSSTQPKGFQLTIQESELAVRAQQELQLGDTLTLSTETEHSIAVYFNEALILRCPSQCQHKKTRHSISLPIEKPGTYQVLHLENTNSKLFLERLPNTVSTLVDNDVQFTLRELIAL